MDPTAELFFGGAAEDVTMAELFGSDEEDASDPEDASDKKKKIAIKKPKLKNRRLNSSARAIVNHMKRRKRRVLRELVQFTDRVDTEWLNNHRLKQRVRPVVSNYTRAKKILEGRKEVDRKKLLEAMNALLERTVQLLRTQDKMRADLAELSAQASRTKTHVREFVNSVLVAGKQALVEVPPFLPATEEALKVSFFQLRSCNRPTDPRKLFSRRSQAAAKSMAKEASGDIPDAAPQVKKESDVTPP